MPENNGNQESRLDRMERVLDLVIQGHLAFQDEQKRLLTAQVVMSDQFAKLGRQVDRLGEKVERLVDKVDRIADNVERLWEISGKHQERLDRADDELEKLRLRIAELSEATDAKIHALIEVVDELIRKRPPEPPQQN